MRSPYKPTLNKRNCSHLCGPARLYTWLLDVDSSLYLLLCGHAPDAMLGSPLTGLCGKHKATDKPSPAACGATGFGARQKGVSSLQDCAARCLACGADKCRYAVFSKLVKGGDCSLFASCDTSELFVHRDYQTQMVMTTAASSHPQHRRSLPSPVPPKPAPPPPPATSSLQPNGGGAPDQPAAPAAAPLAAAAGGCTIVNFRHLVKCGGTGWGIRRDAERLFCSKLSPNHTCLTSNVPSKLDAPSLARLKASGFLVESHTDSFFWAALMRQRQRAVNTAAAPNVWPTWGCRTVVAILLRDTGVLPIMVPLPARYVLGPPASHVCTPPAPLPTNHEQAPATVWHPF